jgi:hypothetical protein
MMDAFSEFLRRIGTHNLLIFAIAILVSWLLISGFLKGWKKRDDDRDSQSKNGGDEDSSPGS